MKWIISFFGQMMDRLTAAQVFVTIAERGSLTATAEQLDMSRAMVTRYLGEMEAWVGARLFHRFPPSGRNRHVGQSIGKARPSGLVGSGE